MSKKIAIGLLTISLFSSFCYMHMSYVRLKRIESIDNTKEKAVMDFTYIEPDDDDIFYSSEELVDYLLEDISHPTDNDNQEDAKFVLEEICEGTGIVVEDGVIKVPVKSTHHLDENNIKDKVIKAKYTDSEKYQTIMVNLKDIAESCLNTPYVWGGETRGKGMDCSGFVQYVYSQLGFTLPRRASQQSKVGKLVKRTELRPGDLLFFDTSNARNSSDRISPESEIQHAINIEQGKATNVISHVGLYMGNGTMIHAASGDGYVKYESLDSEYYKNRFINARRLIRDCE